MFDSEKFKKQLKTAWLGSEFQYFEELDSTNSYLKQCSLGVLSHGMVCLADNQTRGRGQYERNWESSPFKNLTFTITFKPAGAERLHVLTLVCGFAVIKLLENEYGLQASIRWPNDIVVSEKKLGGLLTETVFSGNHLDRVLIGIGLNINQEEFSDEIQNKATSLINECQREIEREYFLAEYLSLVEHYYTLWHQNSLDLIKAINQKIIGYGEWITISVNGRQQSKSCKLLGIDEKGQLVVINKEAEVETYSYEQIRLITD